MPLGLLLNPGGMGGLGLALFSSSPSAMSITFAVWGFGWFSYKHICLAEILRKPSERALARVHKTAPQGSNLYKLRQPK
jgi:hypothetical protein